jgi:fructose-1,6-bisphosphatase/inositol monophosphatase family enzyme
MPTLPSSALGASDSSFAAGIGLAVRQAGAAARMMQGRVENEGKADATALPNDDAALQRRREAKTMADEVAQEILLLAACDLLDLTITGVDAEEDTPSRALFGVAPDVAQMLVIDPIDGTIEYCEGKDSYSICVGLVRGGVIITVVVYFPARDVLYSIENGIPPRCYQEASRLSTALPLRPPRPGPPDRVIYKNGRVSADSVRRLESAGFDVRDDTEGQIGAPDAILACLDGTAAAYVSHTRQMRDILLGAVIAGLPSGSAFDWHGQPLRWPAGGRVPRALFMADSTYTAEIVECLEAE